MADSARLVDLATVLRSKNAGPFELTLDILFDDEASYRRVKDSGVINRERIAELYRVSPETISHPAFFDPALGIKITMNRPIASGGIGDSDVYGAQQHAPLLEVRIPGEE